MCVHMHMHTGMFVCADNTREKWRDAGKGEEINHQLGYEGQYLGQKLKNSDIGLWDTEVSMILDMV